jgi:hypothetical protein
MPDDTPIKLFRGFSSPNFTSVPDELFDELLPELSGSELKVLLYIIRRTFGFKRDDDNISLSQMLNGIVTTDGRVLDRGAGIRDKKTLLAAIKSLDERKIILTNRRQSAERGNEPTTYSLNMRHKAQGGKSPLPLGGKPRQGVGGQIPPSPWGGNPATQETVSQQTDFDPSKFEGSHDDVDKTDLDGFAGGSQQSGGWGRPADQLVPAGDVARLRAAAATTIGNRSARDTASFRASEAPPRRGRPVGNTEERELLAAYLGDFVTQLGDEAPLSSTVTRTLKILKEAGVPMQRWPDLLYEAKSITWEHSAQIKKKPSDPSKTASVKVRIPYYLAVLESLVGLRPEPTNQAQGKPRAS